MKIREAQQLYRAQVEEYQAQKVSLSKQLQSVRSRMEHSAEKKEQYGEEAATLELSLEALSEKQNQYYDYLNRLSDQYCARWNAAAAKQQAEAAEDYTVEVGKILEVARRIMKGGIVPASDEKKLMEYDFELYQVAKNIGTMVQREKRERYKTLWKDEEEKEYIDPQEAAENAEAVSGAPEIVDAGDVMAAVEK